MSILSKLFSNPNKQKDSYVRRWAEHRLKELSSSNEITQDHLFAAIMFALGTFGWKYPGRETIPGLIDMTQHFGSDATLFEVGCYLYFRLCDFLASLRITANLRNEISKAFIREFCSLFTNALGIDKVPELVVQRFKKYLELKHTGAELKVYHFHLSQLIARTKDGTLPQAYDFDNEPVNLDFAQNFAIEMELKTWEQCMMTPALTESLANYCKLKEGQPIASS